MDSIDIKTELLILVNLALIETLMSLSLVTSMGVIISRLKEPKKERILKISVFYVLLWKMLILIFANILIKILGGLVVLGALVLICTSLKYFYQFKKEHQKPWASIWLYLVISFMLIMESPGFDPEASVMPAVAFTDNLYLIFAGILISMVSLYWISYWVLKLAQQNPLIQALGFVVVFISAIKTLIVLIIQGRENGEWMEHLELFYSLCLLLMLLVCLVYSVVRKVRGVDE